MNLNSSVWELTLSRSAEIVVQIGRLKCDSGNQASPVGVLVNPQRLAAHYQSEIFVLTILGMRQFSDVSSDGQATGIPEGATTFARIAVANVARLGVLSLVGILLPPYLTHHLSVVTYDAWVLILRLGAYVAYLDLCVQTAVSKYIAEYAAKKDLIGCWRIASTVKAIMLAASIAGVLTTMVLAWYVPSLLRNMPSKIYGAVRVRIILVGILSPSILALRSPVQYFLVCRRTVIHCLRLSSRSSSMQSGVCWVVHFRAGLILVQVFSIAATSHFRKETETVYGSFLRRPRCNSCPHSTHLYWWR